VGFPNLQISAENDAHTALLNLGNTNHLLALFIEEKEMFKKFLLVALFGMTGMAGVIATSENADAGFYSQRYGGWSYYNTGNYYYRPYYYKPSPTYTGYRYHYCIHYTSQPRYVYYYNRYNGTYWGRYDLEKGGYSMLEEKDRKADLKDIPESAFPEPGEMPTIPESEGDEKILKIEKDDLPSATAPEDVPGGK
jgi:hypothetical protein